MVTTSLEWEHAAHTIDQFDHILDAKNYNNKTRAIQKAFLFSNN